MPGKHTITGTTGLGCDCARLKNNDGSLGDIIDNNISQGLATVMVKASDGYLGTSGCNDWTKVG